MKLFLICLSVLLVMPGYTAQFQVRVTDKKGNPIEEAVVTLKDKELGKAVANILPARITQKNKEFIPRVTVIQVGTPVEFPNQDTVQHHVYSFSQPKRFDLPLYKDATPKPVVFDVPGVVALGCNIHDWMKAYIYVTDTPYFGKSDPDGRLTIANLPPGSYKLVFWHPRLKKIIDKALPETITIEAGHDITETVAVELKNEIVPLQNQETQSGGY